MIQLPAPGVNDDSLLQKKMEDMIAAISAVEHLFPGAIIIHDLRDSSVVYMSQWGLNYLDISLEDLRGMGTEYHSRFFNPDDSTDYAPKVLGMLQRNKIDEFMTYFQQVRRSPHDDYAWYLSGSRVFFRDTAGQPMLILTIALPVDAQHHIAAKAQRLLEENNFLRKNYSLFEQLTSRERQILRLMAVGRSSEEMAERLHIAGATVSTHRRNIKRKL
jgi:hypothetical protein